MRLCDQKGENSRDGGEQTDSATLPVGRGMRGLILSQAADLMVIQERMPPNSTERRHHHSKARQFFYVLSGELTMEVEGTVSRAPSQSGIEIPPLARHQARNESHADVHFLVISSRTTRADRTDTD